MLFALSGTWIMQRDFKVSVQSDMGTNIKRSAGPKGVVYKILFRLIHLFMI